MLGFYELGLFGKNDNQDLFYVNDKLDFLGKDYWRSGKKLEHLRDQYIVINTDQFFVFCQKHNLKHNLSAKEFQQWLENQTTIYKPFKKLPDFIGCITTLKVLNFNHNEHIKHVPDAIFELPNLEVLDLVDNQIKRIPNKIPTLTKLKNLYLLDNYLTDLPAEITELKNLDFANVLYKNDLSKIDPKIKNFFKNLMNN